MTRPHAIIGSALAAAAINVLVAATIILAMPTQVDRTLPQTLHGQAPLYLLSPIPAGADWSRS